jgi:hemerythrin-like domain-containing protein
MGARRDEDGVAGRRVVLAGLLCTTAGSALAAPQAARSAPGAAKPIGDEGVGPGEDLMREHGVLNRILLIYDEAARRIREKEPLPADTVHASAQIISRFLEGYHEKLEEDHLFPRFEKAGRLLDLVTVLGAQHAAGRRETAAILEATAAAGPATDSARTALAGHLGRFVRMYRPHEAREDTVLFPAFRELVTKDEYERLGDAFERRETQVLGARGFERIVDEVAQVERRLGIADLASFTPLP